MFDFSKITEWKLLQGSHEFPGPDGGTCINEAAIVAAGFEYKKVDGIDDLPPCFSRPLSAYAITLNDAMPYVLRQKLLMPFVTKLSGTADTPEIEAKRSQFMALENFRRIISIIVRSYPGCFVTCREVPHITEAVSVCTRLRELFGGSPISDALDHAHLALTTSYKYELYFPACAYSVSNSVVLSARLPAGGGESFQEEIYKIATQILDEAIMLGNHPTDIDIGLVNERMKKAKCRVAA